MLSIRINNKLKISVYPLISIIFLIPDFLQYSSSLHDVFIAWRIIQVIAFALLAVRYFVKNYKNMLVNCMILLYAWIAFSCILHGNTIYSFIWLMAPDLGLAFIASEAVQEKKDSYIHAMMNIMIGYVLLNALTIILIPQGLASGRIGQINWFLGSKNGYLPYLLVTVILIVIDSKLRFNKLKLVSFIKCGVVLACGFLVDSATTKLDVVLSFAIILLDFVIKKSTIKKIFMGRMRLIVILLAVSIYILFFNTYGFLSEYVTNMIGREMTFSSRIYLWEIAFDYIKQNPIIGVGPNAIFFPSNFTQPMTHAHDLYLNIASKYGVPAFLLLAVVIILAYIGKKTPKKNISANFWSAYIILTFYLIASVVEVYLLHPLFLICIILYFANEINVPKLREENV